MIKRIICAIKGHRSYKDPEKIKAFKPEDFQDSSNQDALNNFYIPGQQQHPVNYITSKFDVDSNFTINNGLLISSLHICERCNNVYFHTGYNIKIIDNVDNFPNLIKHKNQSNQIAWEKKIQDEHPTIKKAWDNYQLSIKLCLDNKNNVS